MGVWDKHEQEFYEKHWWAEGDEKRPLCSFCCEPYVSGHWSMRVFVCRDCAVAVLPLLMADAVDRPNFTTQDFKRYADKFLKRFWYGVSCCLSRKIKTAVDPNRVQFANFFRNGDAE